MYRLEESQFGDYTKITCLNKTTGNGFSVVPEMGGTILDIWLNGDQILDACKTPKELENNQGYKSALLFPFPNRLKDGRYTCNGKDYEFPINDPGTDNALHGLGREVEMDVLKTDVSEGHGEVTLSYFDAGENAAYPFAFLFEVIFSLSDKNGFELKMKLTNEANERIPAGLGWHPYFSIGKKVDDLALQIPSDKMIDIDERMIPTSKLLDYDYFKKSRPIHKAVLDNAFKLNTAPGKAEVLLSNNDYTLKYWQETGDKKFNFLQIYTPPDRASIAIEPMTCNIDAFNNGDGLIVLAPEEFIEASCGIKREGK